MNFLAHLYLSKDNQNIMIDDFIADTNNIIATTKIVEENNYYPFGLKHKGYNENINGIDQPSLSEAKSSVVKISEYLQKELTADLWTSDKSSSDLFTVNPFKDNKINKSKPLNYRIKNVGIYKRVQTYHTHPYGNIYTDPRGEKGLLVPSEEDRDFANKIGIPSIILSIKGENHYNKK